MVANARTKPAGRITQADVIVTMLAQMATDADNRLKGQTTATGRAQFIAERNALIKARDRVKRYVAGDATALYR